MERSSDGADAIAMNQSLFFVITHFYTVRSTLYW
jgi:hypothetical protein